MLVTRRDRHGRRDLRCAGANLDPSPGRHPVNLRGLRAPRARAMGGTGFASIFIGVRGWLPPMPGSTRVRNRADTEE